MSEAPHYSGLIQRRDEDQTYVVILPEWEGLYAMPVGDVTAQDLSESSAERAGRA